MTNEEKARILSNKGCLGAYINRDVESLNPTEEDKKRLSLYGACLEAMQWKDEEYKVREEGLRETINALDVNLQKANESGMYYFDRCNVQKQQLIDKACEWLAVNDSYAKPTHLQVDRLREYLKNL